MAISMATDLGTGQRMGHALRSCYLSVALAGELGCAQDEIRTVFQVSLLRFLGCTSDAAELARLTGGDDRAFQASMDLPLTGSRRELLLGLVRSLGAGHSKVDRTRMLARALSDPVGPGRSLTIHCEVAAMLARRLELEEPVIKALAHGFERWDGTGYPAKLRGDAIPFPVRISVVANDADLFSNVDANRQEWLQKRAGHAYDPAVVDAFTRAGMPALEEFDRADSWEAVLECEPQPATMIPDSRVDRVLSVVADFVDLKSPWFRGHSPATAELAENAGAELGLDIDDRRSLRRAGLVHDVGRVGIENGIWDKPAALTTQEWERVRIHPYLTQRVLSRCGALAPLADIAASHHERLDGSGYHRERRAEQLSVPARVLAAADVFVAASAERPYRQAMSREQAAELLRREVGMGRLDTEAVDAVLAAAGVEQVAPHRTWPADLTDREVEVLRLITRGRTNRQVADQLSISPKTVGRHVENIYNKIDVSSRAGAAVFAMEHRLLD